MLLFQASQCTSREGMLSNISLCNRGIVMHRCHREQMESYCTLELKRRPNTDVQVKVCSWIAQLLTSSLQLRPRRYIMKAIRYSLQSDTICWNIFIGDICEPGVHSQGDQLCARQRSANDVGATGQHGPAKPRGLTPAARHQARRTHPDPALPAHHPRGPPAVPRLR